MLYSVVVIACVHKKSPRASIKIPLAFPHQPQFQRRIPSFILFPLNWAFATLRVSASVHGYRVESWIFLCAIWWKPSGIQADLDLPLVGCREDGSSLTTLLGPAWVFVCLFCQFITLQQVCTGRGIHLQYKLPIWLSIFDPRLWNSAAASLNHLAVLIILNIHAVCL